MGSLFAAAVLSLTVAGSVALGITLAYSSVLALLHAFAHSTRKPDSTPTLVLVHSQSQAGAD